MFSTQQKLDVQKSEALELKAKDLCKEIAAFVGQEHTKKSEVSGETKIDVKATKKSRTATITITLTTPIEQY